MHKWISRHKPLSQLLMLWPWRFSLRLFLLICCLCCFLRRFLLLLQFLVQVYVNILIYLNLRLFRYFLHRYLRCSSQCMLYTHVSIHTRDTRVTSQMGVATHQHRVWDSHLQLTHHHSSRIIERVLSLRVTIEIGLISHRRGWLLLTEKTSKLRLLLWSISYLGLRLSKRVLLKLIFHFAEIFFLNYFNFKIQVTRLAILLKFAQQVASFWVFIWRLGH